MYEHAHSGILILINCILLFKKPFLFSNFTIIQNSQKQFQNDIWTQGEPGRFFVH